MVSRMVFACFFCHSWSGYRIACRLQVATPLKLYNRTTIHYIYMFDIIIILILVAFNGFFSLSEVALISARRTRLQSEAKAGSRSADAARSKAPRAHKSGCSRDPSGSALRSPGSSWQNLLCRNTPQAYSMKQVYSQEDHSIFFRKCTEKKHCVPARLQL